MEIEINRLPNERKKAKFTDEKHLIFGTIFTDHFFLAEWRESQGWFNAQIKPYESFHLDPASLIFHYGQQVFEGLKAYKWQDGTIALFRPQMNARRFNYSADRLSLPTIPEDFFLTSIETLVDLEKEWIPSSEDASLYIRPTMIAVEPVLGVRSSAYNYFYIILSPAGSYYPHGFAPIKMMVEERYVRATPGGTGDAKTGGNYAGTLKAMTQAKKQGFDQVIWLDTTKTYVEEGGAMNIFFVYEDRVITPMLDGSILAGITRDSVLKLADRLGFKAEEQKIEVKKLCHDISAGKVKEIFCSGTAAVITPVGLLNYKNNAYIINNQKIGDLTHTLYDTLTKIQYGKIEDPFGWIHKIHTPKTPR